MNSGSINATQFLYSPFFPSDVPIRFPVLRRVRTAIMLLSYAVKPVCERSRGHN